MGVERLETKVRTYTDIHGAEHTLEYCLFNADGYYGVSVWDAAGYGDRIWNLTTRRERAEEIFRVFHDHLVTPVSLREVLEDML